MNENKNLNTQTDRSLERTKRIEEKSARIAEKGERIAKKNYVLLSFYESDSETPAESAQENVATEQKDKKAAQKTDNGTSSKKKKGSGAVIAASVLSSLSLLLVVSFAVCAVLGLIPAPNSQNNDININVSGGGPIQYENYEGSPDMLEDAKASVVVIHTKGLTGSSIGSGIIMSEDGYIITNYHVVEDANSISVSLYNGATGIDAKLIGYSKTDDIAVIKIPRNNLRAATFAISANCRVGDRVYAIGSPEGDDFSWSVTQGIISSTNRELKMYDSEGILQKKMYVLQTDASVNPGNSGGPLINIRGEVVGIITLKLSDSAGMGFAIPSDGALEIINAIIKTGNADDVQSSVSSGRPLMGITGGGVEGGTWYESYISGNQNGAYEVSEQYAAENPDTTFYAAVSGVRVSAITKGLDAENKLCVGDIITEINGVEVFNIYQVMDVINALKGGDTITVKYYRDGNYNTVSITLGTAKQ